MPRMTDVDVDYISLVNKGANKQKIQIYKADDFEPEASNNNEEIKEVTGFFNVLKSFFTGSDDVAKADEKAIKSFKDRIVTREVMDNIWRVNDTLVSTMRDILNTPNIKDKEEALKNTIDEHSAYLKSKVKGVNKIKKAEEFFREEGGDEDMKKEDLQEVIKEVIEPLNEKIETIEKELKLENNEEKEETKEKENTEGITKEDIGKAVKEAIRPLSERVEKIENYKGISKQLEDDEKPVKKSTSVFADLDIF